MGKILCYIYNQMADYELTFPANMLKDVGDNEFITIYNSKEPVVATSGIQYLPHMTVKEALKFDDIEALFIPGGFDRTISDEFIELIRKVENSQKLICAICAAPEFLAKAGILENHKYTTTLGEDYFEKNNIEDCFPRQNYVESKVVRDGNLITAKGNCFIDFGIEIWSYFKPYDKEEEKKEDADYFKGLN